MITMKKWHSIWATILFLVLLSCIYYTYLVSQVGSIHPALIYEAIQQDTEAFGAWAFILDFLFIVGVFLYVRHKRSKKKKIESIWQASEGFGPLLLDTTPVYHPPPPTPEEVELLGILEDENL
tara:strand:- start:13335 stop:13703 length:369 start_codon:yes stop_codon:yes gene_type:complete